MNLSVMRAIARILRSDQNIAAGTGFAPAPSLRLVTAVLCILLCALSRNAWFTISVLAVELMRTALKPAAAVAHILRPVWIAVSFAAVFSIPAIFMGSPGSFGTITMKVSESVLVLSLMNAEVSWKETTAALEKFHSPRIVILTLDQTIRFLVILGRFSNELLEAVSLRRVGKKEWRNAGTGGIAGTTFLKSQQLAQQTSEAMICRGFNGQFRQQHAGRPEKGTKQTLSSLLYALLIPVMTAGFLYTQSLM